MPAPAPSPSTGAPACPCPSLLPAARQGSGWLLSPWPRPARSRVPGTQSALCSSPGFSPSMVERLGSPCGEWTFVSPQWGWGQSFYPLNPAARDEKKTGPGSPRAEGQHKGPSVPGPGAWLPASGSKGEEPCTEGADRPTFPAREMPRGWRTRQIASRRVAPFTSWQCGHPPWSKAENLPSAPQTGQLSCPWAAH